jgi:hypothetical protein
MSLNFQETNRNPSTKYVLKRSRVSKKESEIKDKMAVVATINGIVGDLSIRW